MSTFGRRIAGRPRPEANADAPIDPDPLLPRPAPVGYAIDPKRHLSATPLTPIEAVDGVGDRTTILSMA